MKIAGVISMIIGGLLGIGDILGILTYSTMTQNASISAISIQIFIAILAWLYISIGYKSFKFIG